MKKYETLEISLLFFFEQDVLTFSTNESADDLGSWDNDWFGQGK